MLSATAASPLQLEQTNGRRRRMPYTDVMNKFKRGALHSGSPSGPVVHNPQQAIAIRMSEKEAAEGGKKDYQPPAKPKKRGVGARVLAMARRNQGG
jgi:hypothetical protein